MDQREAYLSALDIPVWRARQAAPVPLPAQRPPQTPTEQVATKPAAIVESVAESESVPEFISKSIPEPHSVDREPSPQQAVEKSVVPDVSQMDWRQLQETVSACTQCGLCQSRTQAVFGVGVPQADLLVVGEGPGVEEDQRGEPFVGRAGQLLDKMLGAIEHSRRQNVYIANIVKCRPPDNRDPQEDEVAACAPYLQRQIQLLQPKLILAVGRIAAQNLLGSNAALGKLRGTLQHTGDGVPVLVTYHPAYLLRKPSEKAKAWVDLKAARQLLAQSADKS